jgi:hypothetical protein
MTGRIQISDAPFRKMAVWCRLEGEIPRLVGEKACSILCHRSQGTRHFDLVFLGGAKCPTLSLWREREGWHAKRIPDHRRRYLTYRGAVAKGRGRVEHLWHGMVLACRIANGLRLSSPAVPLASLMAMAGGW